MNLKPIICILFDFVPEELICIKYNSKYELDLITEEACFVCKTAT
jgi:hypothetical protein